MTNAFSVTPIGQVRSTRSTPVDDNWNREQTSIHLDAARFDESALAGLDAFSHIEVIYVFNKVPAHKIETGARRPRGRQDWPLVGIFGQRGKNRPNCLGATICKVEDIKGLVVSVRGLDAIDGTPVLDIKPVMSGFLPQEEIQEPDWAKEIMEAYW